MAYTWLQAAALLGFSQCVDASRLRDRPARVAPGPYFQVFADPIDAARGADLVTTDVWTSMGFEAENDARRRAFSDWCVDAELMRTAKPDACSCIACRLIAARK